MIAPFRLGTVLSRSFSIWGQNFGTLIALTLVVYSPRLVFTGYQLMAAHPGIVADEQATTDDDPWTAEKQVVNWMILGEALLNAMLSYLAQAVVVFTVFKRLSGHATTVAEGLRGGLRRFPAVLGVSLLVLAIMLLPIAFSGFLVYMVGQGQVAWFFLFGFIAIAILTAPLIWLWIIFWVVVPVVVVERAGVVAALQRSVALTKGCRWQIFGILLLILLLGLAAGLVQVLVTVASAGLGTVVEYVFAILLGAIGATVVTVGYAELVRSKGGTGIDDLAKVFA